MFHFGLFLLLCLQIHSIFSFAMSSLPLIPPDVFFSSDTVVYISRCLSCSVQSSSVAQSCPTLCNPMECSTPGFPVHHQHRRLLKLMSIESLMPSSHLIHCLPLLLPSVFPSIRVISNDSVLRTSDQSIGVSA